MKKRMRIISLCLCMMLVFPIAACGSKKGTSKEAGQDAALTGNGEETRQDAADGTHTQGTADTPPAGSASGEGQGQTTDAPPAGGASGEGEGQAADTQVSGGEAGAGQGQTTDTPPGSAADADEEPKTGGSEDADRQGDEPAIEGAEENAEVRGGYSLEDAVLIPLETKIYGCVEWEKPLWYAFTTDEKEDAFYEFFCINRRMGYRDVEIAFFDAEGKCLLSAWQSGGNGNGQASCTKISEVFDNGTSPDTTYYVRVTAGNSTREWDNTDPMQFMILVRDRTLLDEKNDAVALSSNLSEAKGTGDAADGNIHPGTNMDEAQLIPFDTDIHGTTAVGGFLWFAFKTGDAPRAEYTITHSNDSASGEVYLLFYNEYSHSYFGQVPAKGGQGPVSYTINTYNSIAYGMLQPNTLYYIGIGSDIYRTDEVMDYTLSVHMEEIDAGGNDGDGNADADDEPLVFETPFELNETQIRFVSNKAVFVNEEEAKAALAPVAEILLAHPGHPILIAGTTATTGTQQGCVNLSNKRAEAVKNLLVTAFGVPETQIVTIGLGYENDPFVRGRDRDSRGNFVESEAAKNRRVVIIDINDAIAKRLLNTY